MLHGLRGLTLPVWLEISQTEKQRQCQAKLKTRHLIARFFSLAVISRCLVHPERLELPTSWFEAMRSIQLSYGCTLVIIVANYLC